MGDGTTDGSKTPGGEMAWTLTLAGKHVAGDGAAGFFEMGADTTGVVICKDGRELVFQGFEDIEW